MGRNRLLVGEEWNARIDTYYEFLRKRGRERFDRLLKNAGGDGQVREKEIADLFESAYRTGGRSASVVVDPFVDFDPNHPRVVDYAQRNAAALITDIDAETRDIVKVLVTEGIHNGVPEDEMKKRIQNFVGLDKRRARAVANYQSKQAQAGVPAGQVRKNAEKYAKRLRAERADAILRTELQKAMEQGKLEFWQQAADAGIIKRGDSWRVWVTHPDERPDRPCEHCSPMDGKRARLGGSFHGSLGKTDAPPYHVRCKCYTILEAPIVSMHPIIKHGDKHDEKTHGNWSRNRHDKRGEGQDVGKPGEKVYHVSRPKNRDSILDEGLRLSDIDGMHLWTVDELEVAESIRPGFDMDGQTDIWEIDVEGMSLSGEFHGGLAGDGKMATVVLHDAVSPERLKLIEKHGDRHDEKTHGNRYGSREQKDRALTRLMSMEDEPYDSPARYGKIKPLRGEHPIKKGYYRFREEYKGTPGLRTFAMDASVPGKRYATISVHEWNGKHHSVASLIWSPERSIVQSVGVDPLLRRKGIATAMLEMARRYTPDLQHSKVLTPDGYEWAEVAKHGDKHDETSHGNWARGRKVKRLYHLTDNPKFEPDPDVDPPENALSIFTDDRKGIYLTDQPEYWVNAHNYVRPFIAEVEVLEDSLTLSSTPGSNQVFLPAEQYENLRVRRLIPTDHWVREEFGEAGWVEEYLSDEPTKVGQYRGYRYEGPDVRDMSDVEVQQMIDDTDRYLKDVRGISKHGKKHDEKTHGNWARGKGASLPGKDRPSKEEPGTREIPEGFVRLYHYSDAESLEQIAEHGLQRKKARGSTYGEPDAIWASTRMPEMDHSFVEFAVPFEDIITDNWDSPTYLRPVVGGPYRSDKYTAEEWMEGTHDLAFGVDQIPTDAFIQINRTDDHYYRAIYGDESYRQKLFDDPHAIDEFMGISETTDRAFRMAIEDVLAEKPVEKHASPIHPGTGSDQSVHSGGGGYVRQRLKTSDIDAKVEELKQRYAENDPNFRLLNDYGDFNETCNRCDGEGGKSYWPQYQCFDCHGYGFIQRKKSTMRERAKRELRDTDEEKERAQEERLTAIEASEAKFISEHPELADSMERYKNKDFMADSFIESVMGQARQRGALSAKQLASIGPAIERFDERAARATVEEARRAALPDFKTGKMTVKGRVVSSKYQDSMYGTQLKMLVELEDGNRVWGTVPRSVERQVEEAIKNRSDTNFLDAMKDFDVEFTANFERSKDDEHFGFYKRPSKANATQERGIVIPEQRVRRGTSEEIRKIAMKALLEKHPHKNGNPQSVHAGGERGGHQYDLFALNEERLRDMSREGIDDDDEIVKAGRSLYEQALQREKEITASLKKALGDTGEFHQFEERIKYEASIRDKIFRYMNDKGLSLEEATALVKDRDLNRYTLTWSEENGFYAKGVYSAITKMRREGWKLKNVVWAWETGDLYDGINGRFVKDGITAEVQFHTEVSAEIKMKSHVLYTKARVLPFESPEYAVLKEQTRTLWSTNTIPPTLPQIGDVKEFTELR